MLVRRLTLLALALLLVLPACKGKRRAGESVLAQNRVVTRTIALYFESPDLRLVAEQRTLPLPENEAAAAPIVVREVLKGSANASIPKLWPADIVARGTYLLPDGTAVVDLGGATLVNGWGTGTHNEMMAAYSLVQTLTSNFTQIKRVRLLINGQQADTLAGHIDLRKPLRPLPNLLR